MKPTFIRSLNGSMVLRHDFSKSGSRDAPSKTRHAQPVKRHLAEIASTSSTGDLTVDDTLSKTIGRSKSADTINDNRHLARRSSTSDTTCDPLDDNMPKLIDVAKLTVPSRKV